MKKVDYDKEQDIVINKDFKEFKIDLNEFNLKKVPEQFKTIKEIVSSAYHEDTKLLKEWIVSCIELSCSNKDEAIYLPKNLRLLKKKNFLIFSFKKQRKFNYFLLGIYLLAFIIGILAATYWAVFYLSRAHLNKDIDGDGIADINLDINNDGKAEINIDNNFDDKPDLNIDYKGNRKIVFNIDQDNDGKADYNLVFDATNDKACSINCDTNGDGWPDLNVDINGDKKADFDIDTDGDGVADLNLDTNGDSVCDLMCDTNDDYVCDEFCIGVNLDIYKTSGSTTVTGIPDNDVTTGGLVITYNNNDEATLGVLPDDMVESKPIPDRTFTIENTSNYPIKYRLVWNIAQNNFETDNLKYSLTSYNGGASVAQQTVPKSDVLVAEDIIIPARSIQNYTLSFRFVGIYEEQNIDQNRRFNGIIMAEYDS